MYCSKFSKVFFIITVTHMNALLLKKVKTFIMLLQTKKKKKKKNLQK